LILFEIEGVCQYNKEYCTFSKHYSIFDESGEMDLEMQTVKLHQLATTFNYYIPKISSYTKVVASYLVHLTEGFRQDGIRIVYFNS